MSETTSLTATLSKIRDKGALSLRALCLGINPSSYGNDRRGVVTS
jgi:hypothetical protein